MVRSTERLVGYAAFSGVRWYLRRRLRAARGPAVRAGGGLLALVVLLLLVRRRAP